MVRHPLRSYIRHAERNIYEISHVESRSPCRGCVEGIKFVPEVSPILLVLEELQTFRPGRESWRCQDEWYNIIRGSPMVQTNENSLLPKHPLHWSNWHRSVVLNCTTQSIGYWFFFSKLLNYRVLPVGRFEQHALIIWRFKWISHHGQQTCKLLPSFGCDCW